MSDSLSSRLLEWITGSQATRKLLRRFFNEQQIEDALDVIVGKKKAGTLSCLMASSLLRFITLIGSSAFGTSSKLIEENLANPLFRRAFSDVVKGLTEFGMTRPFVPGAPFQVVWNITRACNLKCQHCYENAGRKDNDELGTEEAIRCIDKLADAGVLLLAFSGGEPTLRPDILRLIERAANRGIYVAMATNGLTFSDPHQVRLFKDVGLSFVQISLDGSNPETHDAFRGMPGAHERTLKAIQNCVNQGLFVEVAMTATHYNLDEVEETIEIADRFGARWFMLYNFVPAGRGEEITDSDLDPDEREELLKFIWSRIEKRNDQSTIEVLSTAPQLGRIAREASTCSVDQSPQSIFPTHFSNARLPERMKDLASFIGGCGAGRFYLAVEPNGDIYPCVFFPHSPNVYLGNLLDCDFDRMWKSSGVLRKLRNRELLKGNCGVCSSRDVCGGCRARSIGYFEDYLAPDPGCINNRETWMNLLNDSIGVAAHLCLHPVLSMEYSDPNWGVA